MSWSATSGCAPRAAPSCCNGPSSGAARADRDWRPARRAAAASARRRARAGDQHPAPLPVDSRRPAGRRTGRARAPRSHRPGLLAGGQAERDQVARDQRPGEVARGGQISEQPAPPVGSQRPRIDAADADPPLRIADAGDGVEQAGLAAAVRPDQADQRPRFGVDVARLQPALKGKALRLEQQGAHRSDPPRIWATSQSEEGRPEQGGDHAIGSVRPSGAVRTTRSASSSRSRRQSGGDDGTAGMGAGQPAAKIGATRPTKPIAPQIATQRRPRARSARRSGAGAERVMAERDRHLLAERELSSARSSGPAAHRQQSGTAAKPALGEASVEQRAHQPVIGVVVRRRGGGESQASGSAAPPARDRQAGEQSVAASARGPGARSTSSRAASAPPPLDRQAIAPRSRTDKRDDRAERRAAGLRSNRARRGVGEQSRIAAPDAPSIAP